MGCAASNPKGVGAGRTGELAARDDNDVPWQKMQKRTNFSASELAGLHGAFTKLVGQARAAPHSTVKPAVERLKDRIQRAQFLSACANVPDIIGLAEAVGYFGSRLFDVFDTDGDGLLSFEDFAMGLSKLLRGSDSDKLKIAFRAYNVSGKGKGVSKEDMVSVISLASEAAYPMLSQFARSERRNGKSRAHSPKGESLGGNGSAPGKFHDMARRNAEAYVQRAVAQFDLDKDGRLSQKELEQWVLSRPTLRCRLDEYSIDLNVAPFQGVQLS